MSPRPFLRGVRALATAQPRTRADLQRYQLACVRDLVAHAYRHVPYYRELLDRADIRPQDIRSLEDFAAIPASPRADLQMLTPEEACSSLRGLEGLRTITTSGSTGAPLTVRRTVNEERLLLAFRSRAVASCGFGLRMRRATVDYRPDGAPDDSRLWTHQKLGILPSLELDWRTPKAKLVSAMEAFRPDIINGPPSMLAWLADELTADDRRRIGGRFVVAGSERFTSDLRERIEAGFGLPAGDIYGSHETVFIAFQRPGSREYRVCEQAVRLEVLCEGRPVGPGESGEVVVTALHSYAMPFIRYRLGDEATLGSGSGPYLSLRSIDGRTLDRFRLTDSRYIVGYALGDCIKGCGVKVRRYQIVQERRDLFRVRLVAAGCIADADLARLREAMRRQLPGDTDLVIERLDTIEQKSRKFVPFVPLERFEARGSH